MPSESKVEPDDAPARVSSNVAEDAESFLPSATPLHGEALSVGRVAFSPDGKRLAMGAGWSQQTVGELRLWDIDNGRMLITLRTSRPVRSVVFSPDGKLLAAGSFNGPIKLGSTADGKEMALLEGHKDLIFAVHFSPDGKTLTSASKDETVRLWQVMTADAASTSVAGRGK